MAPYPPLETCPSWEAVGLGNLGSNATGIADAVLDLINEALSKAMGPHNATDFASASVSAVVPSLKVWYAHLCCVITSLVLKSTASTSTVFSLEPGDV
jgi:hypothetical protein